jgi:hypothetical protein
LVHCPRKKRHLSSPERDPARNWHESPGDGLKGVKVITPPAPSARPTRTTRRSTSPKPWPWKVRSDERVQGPSPCPALPGRCALGYLAPQRSSGLSSSDGSQRRWTHACRSLSSAIPHYPQAGVRPCRPHLRVGSNCSRPQSSWAMLVATSLACSFLVQFAKRSATMITQTRSRQPGCSRHVLVGQDAIAEDPGSLTWRSVPIGHPLHSSNLHRLQGDQPYGAFWDSYALWTLKKPGLARTP